MHFRQLKLLGNNTKRNSKKNPEMETSMRMAIMASFTPFSLLEMSVCCNVGYD